MVTGMMMKILEIILEKSIPTLSIDSIVSFLRFQIILKKKICSGT
jgi:hypothetical protein